MIFFSEVLDTFYCRKAQVKRLDEAVAFCNYFGGLEHRVTDAKLLILFKETRDALVSQRGVKRPKQYPDGYGFKFKGKDFLDDLYVPHCFIDSDKTAHFTFPGFGFNRLSSSGFASDWRFLLMAWPVFRGLAAGTKCHFKMIYPDQDLDVDIPETIWAVLADEVLRLTPGLGKENPGRICGRCLHRSTCTPCQEFLRSNLLPGEGKVTKDTAYKLILERVDLRTRIEIMKQREKEIGQQLKSLLQDNRRFEVDSVLAVEPSMRTTTEYPYPDQVYSLMSKHGLWSWDFVKVLSGVVNKNMKDYPEAIQRLLKALRREVKHEGTEGAEEILGASDHSLSQGDVARRLLEGL